MPFGFELIALALVLGIVFLGGVVKGTAGFGYAIASTAVLAAVLEPRQAVVIMILPMLVANVTLLRELDRDDVRTCVRRFWPYVLAALVGTALGMALLSRVPRSALTLGLGVFTLAYVVISQDAVRVPGAASVASRCFQSGLFAKAALGLFSGVVFGASNVAVQMVAYLDSLSLDRSTFVGVLAMILVGVSSVRVALAWTGGLYGSGSLLVVSTLAVGPGLVGVTAGQRLRRFVPDRAETLGALLLLAVIGTKLTVDGLGAL